MEIALGIFSLAFGLHYYIYAFRHSSELSPGIGAAYVFLSSMAVALGGLLCAVVWFASRLTP